MLQLFFVIPPPPGRRDEYLLEFKIVLRDWLRPKDREHSLFYLTHSWRRLDTHTLSQVNARGESGN